MRLIDADAIVYFDMYMADIKCFEKIVHKEQIDAMPTVEQKHGHWIMEDAANATFNGRRTQWKKWRCSACNIMNGNRRPDYCPHCGVKMDEVSE